MRIIYAWLFSRIFYFSVISLEKLYTNMFDNILCFNYYEIYGDSIKFANYISRNRVIELLCVISMDILCFLSCFFFLYLYYIEKSNFVQLFSYHYFTMGRKKIFKKLHRSFKYTSKRSVFTWSSFLYVYMTSKECKNVVFFSRTNDSCKMINDLNAKLVCLHRCDKAFDKNNKIFLQRQHIR